jgi:hypothetical protein
MGTPGTNQSKEVLLIFITESQMPEAISFKIRLFFKDARSLHGTRLEDLDRGVRI